MKIWSNKIRQDAVSLFSLFSSLSTLLCCALPILMVVLGLGAVTAGLISSLPFLAVLGKYKVYFFLFSGLIITSNFLLLYRNKKPVKECLITENAETACEKASRMSKIILWTSCVLYAIGFFAAYLLPWLII